MAWKRSSVRSRSGPPNTPLQLNTHREQARSSPHRQVRVRSTLLVLRVYRGGSALAMQSRFMISRLSRSANCAVSSWVKPSNASRFPWKSTVQASGSRASASFVSETRLLRPSDGSGVRRIKPSRSIRTIICAIEDCSILAYRARSRCVSARPFLSATSTGRCPTPNPSGFKRASAKRAKPRAARLIR